MACCNPKSALAVTSRLRRNSGRYHGDFMSEDVETHFAASNALIVVFDTDKMSSTRTSYPLGE
jgi:hypothetical protein